MYTHTLVLLWHQAITACICISYMGNFTFDNNYLVLLEQRYYQQLNKLVKNTQASLAELRQQQVSYW